MSQNSKIPLTSQWLRLLQLHQSHSTLFNYVTGAVCLVTLFFHLQIVRWRTRLFFSTTGGGGKRERDDEGPSSSSGGGTWPSSPRLGGEREKLPHLHRLWVRAALRESGLSVQPHHWTVRETVGSLFEVQSRVKLHNDMSRYGFFGPYWYAPIWADMHRYEPKCTNMSRYACTDMSWYAPIWADMKLSTISAAYQLSVIVPSQISVIVSVTKIHIGRPLYWALQT